MKILITLLLLSSILPGLAYSQASFEEIYALEANADYAALADQIVAARFDEHELSPQQNYTRLKNLQARIQAKIDRNKNDPMAWFVSGLNLNNLAEVRYLLVLAKSGQKKAAADVEVTNYNIARSRAYNNAIRLDGESPHQLSSAIYATMGYGLSNREKIKTYSRELELGSASENESNEWFMHWAKIDALVHEKKLDEAQQALAELKQKLEEKNKTDSPYSSIAKRAESQVDKVTAKAKQRQAKNTKKQPKPVDFEDTNSTWNWKTWLILCFGVFTFVSVLAAAIYRRNR